MTNHYAVDQESFDELAAMSHALREYIQNESIAERGTELAEIFDMFGEILADVERRPVIIKEGRHQ
jgi:hypothetical protein